MGDPLEEERIAQLRQLLGVPTPQDQPAPPSADNLFNIRAHDLEEQAKNLESQAVAPQGPSTTGGKIGEALRAGLEGFTGGFTGGPGYFEHQSARDAQERQREQDLVTQAKSFRGEGAQQQQLGLSALGEQNQQSHNEAMLGETQRLRALQEHEQSNKEEVANRPQPVSIPADTTYGTRDPKTGVITTQGTTPKAASTSQLQHVVIKGDGGKPEVWAVDMSRGGAGERIKKIGDAVLSQGANGDVQAQYTDPETGEGAIGVLHKGSAVITPAQLAGGNGGPVHNATAGNQAVREKNKSFGNLQGAQALFNTMRDTLARLESGKSTAPGADDLVLLSNHIAMTMGSVKGARTGRDIIEAHKDAISLDNKLSRAVNQVMNGGQLSPDQRREFVHLAEQRLGEMEKMDKATKEHFGGTGPDNPSSFIKPGGALEGLLKGGGGF